MGKTILYSLADEASQEAEDLLKSRGIQFEIWPHLFNDTDEPVVRFKDDFWVGLPEIRLLALAFA